MLKRLWIVLSLTWSVFFAALLLAGPEPEAHSIAEPIIVLLPWMGGPSIFFTIRWIIRGRRKPTGVITAKWSG
jgi:hypothetical protein